MNRLSDTDEIATDRGPRRGWVWAAITYGLAALSLGYPALVGKFLVNPHSDQYIAGFAFREFAASALKATGEFPLWNPYLLGGMPYVAAMHGDIFYPTFLLRLVMPTDVAMTWGFIIHLFLAGLFTFAFLRALGLGFYSSLIGGLAYMLSGNIAGLVSPGHDGKLYMSALLPLTMLLVLRGVRDGRPWSWGALSVVIGLAVLTPHPQLLQYLLLTSGAFGVFLAFTDLGQGRLPRATALRRLALAAGAVVLGGLMGAIQYLPVREYVAWSPRAGGQAWETAVSYSMPLEEMVNFYLPHFSGLLDAYWGKNGIHLHSEYIGVAVLILAGLAFARSWHPGHRRLIWFWTGAFVIALLWALGGHTPFYRLVYAIVPGTKFFRAPSTMLYVVSFCAAMLAAFGADRAIRRQVATRYIIGWAVAGAVIAVIALAGGLSNLAASVARPDRVDFAMANDAATKIGALRSTLFGALTLACLFLLGSARLGREMGGLLLAGIIGVDLWSVERHYWMFSERASTLYASDATIDYIKQRPEPGRVLPADFSGQAGGDPFVHGDALMTNRVRSALGYHGNELGNYVRLGGRSERWRPLVTNPNLWRLLNVRYLLTNEPELGVSSLKRVVGPVRNAFGTMVYLFEMQEDHPAAWVVPVIVKAGDEAVLGMVLNPLFDVRRAALFDTSVAVTGATVDTLPTPLTIRAKVSRYDPGAIDIELDQPAPAGSALMVSENYYPGWTASVDDKPATIGRADVSLIGVVMPAGGRRITLRFASRPYETGKTVTKVALLLALVAWGAGALIGKRRRV